MTDDVRDEDYKALAAFRYQLRRFLRFSEQVAVTVGLSAQQYQALLAIRAEPGAKILVGEFAERMLLKPHSATELVDRLEKVGVVQRLTGPGDRRQTAIALTPEGEQKLASLAASHREELLRIQPQLTQAFVNLLTGHVGDHIDSIQSGNHHH